MVPKIDSAGQIVVGTDGSQRAHKAVEWAADQAAVRKLPLRIVFVVPEVPLPGRTAAAAKISQGTNYLVNFLEKSQRKLDEAVEWIRAKSPDITVVGQLVQGNPSYLLAEASKDAAMVVVGARGEGAPLSVRMLGGVSDAVVQHAHGPVAVVDDEADEHVNGPVVVGIDESDASKAAIALAFEAAELHGVPLIAVNAWDVSDYADKVWDGSLGEITGDLTEMVEGLLADQMAAHPGVPVEIKVIRGVPEAALVEESKNADLVVVGSRGRGGFKGLLLGSTSKHVLREAYSPVIVTRG